jgi:hypothetical protein
MQKEETIDHGGNQRGHTIKLETTEDIYASGWPIDTHNLTPKFFMFQK